MIKASLVVPLVLLFSLCLPFGIALGNNNDDTPFFDIGQFDVTRNGDIMGTYIPQALEGVTISLYSDTGDHLMDIQYQECCIVVYIEIFNDALINTLLERGIIERGNLFRITFTGEPQMSFTYEDCTVELQDATISFLRIQCPGKIIFSNLSTYELSKTTENIVTLTNDEFYGTIRGPEDLILGDNNITTQKSVTFRGIPLLPDNSSYIEEIRTVDDAINQGDLGGEITIVKRDNQLDWMTTSYAGNVTIEMRNTSAIRTKTQLVVNGDEKSAGKTIKVNLGKGVLSSQDIHITFDDHEIPLADNISDVLNPNDDGLQPEYVLVEVTGGKEQEFFVLISIPHFSEHIITLESIQSNPLAVAMTLASAFAVIAVASWTLFRR